MNHIYRLRWNRSLARWIVTSELSRGMGKGHGARRRARVNGHALAVAGLGLSLGLAGAAFAGPTGGKITAGSGQITQSGTTTTIQQSSQNLSLGWQSFDIGSQETVNFVQPNASSLAVNRISSASASEILGHLHSNGQVWLINPNGVLFGEHAQVSVGGLVASTLDTVGDDANASQKFSGNSQGAVVNQGTITAANGGYVALLGHHVSNQGVISAQLGTVALGAGSAQTLTFNGNHLVHLQVDASQLNDLVENRQLIQANGGQVFMTAGAKNAVLASVVNNTGIVQAQTVENHNGTIILLGGGAGTVTVNGTLDASAPHGGDGGSIETSGAKVDIAAGASVRANAPSGRSGTWLVDPEDLTIDPTAATTISQSLESGTNVTEQTTSSAASGAGQQTSGLGDITVASGISWSNAAATLTLDAYHGINVDAPVSGAGQVVMAAHGGNLTLNSAVSGQAGVTLSTAANFINNAGATGVSAGSGARWLVYSTNPTLDTTGGLTPDFIQYAAAGGTSPTPATGSGFLYSVAPSLTVTALSGPVTKTYDGTTTATLSGSNMTVNGLLNGDTVTSLAGTYAAADAATGINLTSSTDASTLVVANGTIPVYGYGLTGSAITAAVGTISPKQLTASIIGTPTKTYDGTTTATLSSSNYSLSGFVGGQGATVSQPSTVGFASADASQNAVVNATFTSTNFTPTGGANLADYILPTSATGAGIINQAPVNLMGLLALNKTYDTTDTASLDTSNARIFGVIAPDVGNVTLDKSGGAATFSQSNAGSNLTVTVTPNSFLLTGTKASNYTLIAPTDLVASITARGLTLNNVAGTNKTYDGNTTDSLNFGSATLFGVLAADVGNVGFSTTSATGTFASPDAANGIAVSASGVQLTGTAAGNYSLAQPTGIAANITPKALTITLGGNQVKPYNGTRTAAVDGTDFTITGFVGSESAAITQNALAQYSTPNAGTSIPVTATLEASDFTPASGTLMSNYSFPHTVTGNTGTINAIPLNAYITNNPTKTYDGNTTATVTSADYVLTGFVGSESATVSQPVGTYASPNAGPETVTASVTAANFTAGSGTLLSNYILPTSISGAGTIQPQQLGGNYINGYIVNNPTKTYDGTTVAHLTPSNFQLTGFVAGQGATVTQTTGQYSGANVGAQTVTAQLASGDFTPNAGTNLSNYVLPTVVYGSGTINPAQLTVSIVGNPTKVYDGTTTTTLLPSNYQVSGFVSGEGAVITPSSLINYDSKDVGTHTITADLTASAYTPTGPTLMSNYILATSATGPGQITQAPLYVIGIAANNKVYNGTTGATLNIANVGLGGLVTGESGLVTLNTTTSGTFAQADVANGVAVSTTGFSISGAGASNYALQPVTGLRANITPAPLTILGVTANDKAYDGTTAGTLSAGGASLQGIFNSDDVTLNSASAAGTLASANAGSGIPVAASGFTLSGTKAFDYTVSQPTGLSATINPAVVTATIIGNPTKQYDGSNSATLTNADYSLSGFAAGQGATVPQSATANYLSANAGTNIGLESTLVISDFVPNAGTNLANYVMPSSATGVLGTITPKVLNLSGTRVYDTTTNAGGSLFGTLTGLNGDTLTVSGTGTLVSKNVGTESFASLGSLTLNSTGAAIASNYTLVGGIDWVKITPATLTVTGTTGSTKTYDGNTSAVISGATLNGVLSGDSVTLGNDTSGNFTDKNVGTNKTIITAMTVGGTDVGNYVLQQPTDAKGSITANHITVTATGQNKQYDATTSDNAALSSTGVVSGDAVTFTGTATFDTKNVGTAKPVSVINIAASGADAGNYILDNSTASTSADITARVLNLSGTRVYDTTTDANADLFTTAGLLATGFGGESLTLTGTGTLTSKNVSNAQTFASLGTLSLGDGTNGGLASNYTLVGGTDRVKITPAALTVVNTAVTTKTYDGNTNADLTGATLQGVLGSDQVSLGNASTGTFADKNVGTNKTVTTAMTLGDTDKDNYTLTQPTLTGDITSKGITVTATGIDKSYDGTTTAGVTLSTSQLAPGDSLTFTDSSATFATKDAGTGIAIDVQGIQATGTGASNYTLANTTASTSANINKAVLDLSGTRVYDADTDASSILFTSGGLLTTGIGTETVQLSGTGVLASKNVNSAQPFSSLGTLSLSDGTNGGLASNYTLVGGTDTVNITPLHVTVAATGANKIYDRGVNDPGLTLSSAGIYGTDAVTISDTSATFADKNAQDNKTVTVTGISLSGTDAGNYALDNTTATTAANITAKTLTITATASNKNYNGTNAASVSLSAGSGGIISGDTVTIGHGTATFSDANAASGKTVTVPGINLTGTDASNYVLANTSATTTATISPLKLNLSGTRVYDDNTDADFSLFAPGGVFTTGVGTETLVLSGSGVLASKNVNSAQSFSSLGTLSLADGTNGGLASNYTLVGGTDKVNVTPLHITVTATGANKTYDGGVNDPGLTLGSAGIYSGDLVTLADTSATFADKTAQDGKTVTVTGIAITGGTDANNYVVDNTIATTTANIGKKPLTITIVGTDKTYDGSANDTITLSAGVGGILSGDSVTIGATSSTFSDANAGLGKTVTASGLSLSGGDSGNYSLTGSTATTTANISQAVINLTGTRAYNSLTTAAASLFGTNGVLSTGVNGETVVLTGSGTLASKDVNTQQPFSSVSGFTLGDGTGLASNYTLTGGTDWVNITPLHITVAATGANKTYDGNVLDPGLTLTSSGVISGDSVTFADTSATFADKNVGNAKTVSVAGISIAGGADAANYALDNNTASTTATITPKPITVAAAGVNKVYDATTSAQASLTSGQIVSGDDVTFTATSTLFGDKNIGSGKTINVAGITASGNDSGNYSYNNSATTTANITPAALTVVNTLAGSKTYDGNTVAALTGATLSGVQGNDDVTLGNQTAGAFGDPNAGTGKTVTTAMTVSGTDVGNYTFTQPTGLTANISQAVLNLTASRQYDGTTGAAAALFGSGGVLNGVNGETLTLGGTGTLSSKNVSPAQTFSSLSGFTLSGNGPALASNYTLTGGTDWVQITPAPLAVLGTLAGDKVYDGTTVASLTGATLSGIKGTDDVSLDTAGSGTFADKNVGAGKTVTTAMTISGADAGNYTFAQPTGLTASITPRSVLVTATGIDKVYDGNTLDEVTLSTAGFVAGDAVAVSNGSALFADKNVGNGKTVSVSGIAVNGADAGNYSYNTTTTTTASITPKAASISATAQNKVYDGNTNALGTTLMANGILPGDTVSFTDTSATFGDKNVGDGKNVTVLGISASGADGGNYSYNSTAVAKANITPAPLTVTGTLTTNRTYDGTVADGLSGATLAGVVSGDAVTLGNDTSGTFATKNVGTGKAVTTNMTIGGADASNYTLSQPTNLVADVTAKTITVAAIGTNKTYDGKTGDKVTLASDGIVSGDDVTLTDSGANFSSANVGKGKTVTVTGLQVAGSDAANYALASDTVTTTADIATGTTVQDTAVAVSYLELSPDAIATPYGVAPAASPGQLTGNKKLLHRAVEANSTRVDFRSGLALQVVDGGVRVPGQ